MHGTDPGNYEKTAGEGRGASFSKSKNWFPICNNTHLSPAFDVFSPKGEGVNGVNRLATNGEKYY